MASHCFVYISFRYKERVAQEQTIWLPLWQITSKYELTVNQSFPCQFVFLFVILGFFVGYFDVSASAKVCNASMTRLRTVCSLFGQQSLQKPLDKLKKCMVIKCRLKSLLFSIPEKTDGISIH